MRTAILSSPIGKIEVSGDKNGLSAVTFKDESSVKTNSDEIPDELLGAVLQLNQYFEGKIHEFDLKLNLNGTDFQKRVWQQLLKIPYGKTCTYMEIAKHLGDSKVIRAAASANGKNPLSIIIP
ncbi:MAG: methylated-DNA--[protein]-cysteine S-methyltransferase, partial [Leeuwenhoekiella sp.]